MHSTMHLQFALQVPQQASRTVDTIKSVCVEPIRAKLVTLGISLRRSGSTTHTHFFGSHRRRYQLLRSLRSIPDIYVRPPTKRLVRVADKTIQQLVILVALSNEGLTIPKKVTIQKENNRAGAYLELTSVEACLNRRSVPRVLNAHAQYRRFHYWQFETVLIVAKPLYSISCALVPSGKHVKLAV